MNLRENTDDMTVLHPDLGLPAREQAKWAN